MRPGTPLPWVTTDANEATRRAAGIIHQTSVNSRGYLRIGRTSYWARGREDAQFIVHSANAYLEFVGVIKQHLAAKGEDHEGRFAALLRKLGESP